MRSIRLRVGLGVALLTLIAVLTSAAAQFSGMRAYLLAAEQGRLIRVLPLLDRELRAPPLGGALPQPLARLPRTVDVRVVQGGRVVAVTPDFPELPLRLPLGFRKQARHDVLVVTVGYQGQVAQAQLASDVLGIVSPLDVYLRSLGWSLPVTVILAGLLGSLLTGALLSPLRRLGEAAERVAASGDWRQPLPLTAARDEVGQLARLLQSGFAQVAEVREREELFTRAAAHDLRSPLTALKTRLQGALSGPRREGELREEIREALTDVERMRALSEHLLRLGQGLRDIELRPLDLAALAGEVVDGQREQAPELAVEFESSGPCTVSGDPVLLRQLLRNLIQNALGHGSPPVLVRVCGVGSAGEEGPDGGRPGTENSGLQNLGAQNPGAGNLGAGGAVELTVSDQGRPQGEGGAPGGSGVGLQLVRRVAQAHGAELRLRGSETGAGWQVELRFPAGPER